MQRRDFLWGSGLFIAGTALANTRVSLAAEGEPEKPDLIIGVGGKPLLYYLPLTIAERKGFFVEEGLNVTVNDFAGGAKSLQALVGGSVDVVAGAYEHTIRMQNKGQDIVAVCGLGRFPGIVIAVRSSLADEIRTIDDLKGRTIGVTAPGSSTALMLQYAIRKAGLRDGDVAMVGIGSGSSAIAAIQNGMVDGLSHLDPVIAQLQSEGELTVLVDTRTETGTRALFDGPNPAATVYVQNDFSKNHPITMQRLVNAFCKSLKFIRSASAEDIAAIVPEDYLFGNRDLYKRAFQNSREMYSPDGTITEEGHQSMISVLRQLDPELSNVYVPFSKTFDGQYVARSKT